MAPLVFFPGAGGLPTFWGPVARRLADLGPALLLGYPGFGGEPGDPEIRDLHGLHRWCLGRLPAKPVHVVAQSMGGVLAVQLALEAPERVASLTLTATSGGVPVAAMGGAEWRGQFREEHPEVPDWFERDETDHTSRLGALRVPTLIVHGDMDPICPPAVAEFLAARIPGARRVLVRGGTHAFAEERPDEVAALVRAHVIDRDHHAARREQP